MSKYHVNPRTGNPGVCRASIKCRFGGSSSHFATKEEARADYEDSQERLARRATSPREAMERLDKEVSRGLELLDSTRMNDGSVFGASKQSRAEGHWKKAKYLISQYVDKHDSWAARRGYYHQVSDELHRLKYELGEGDWGGPQEVHKPLLEHVAKLEKDFRDICGPAGEAKEQDLGFYKKG